MAVYLLVGPDACYWYTVHAKYAPQFRKLVQENYNLDIHKEEGLWFGDIDFFIKHGIKIQFYVQQPGDIVIVFNSN